MNRVDDLTENVDTIISSKWEVTDGRVVPESSDVGFLAKAVKLDAAFLYADMADSTALAKRDKWLASEVFQCFLSCASKVMKYHGGEIRSFDGDRVMAVFIGNKKRTNAAMAALKFHWVFRTIVKPKLLAAYAKKLEGLDLSYGIGVATGLVWSVRAGVRNDSDLVFVGQAPNLAAKLSSLRCKGYPTYITADVYDKMMPSVRLGGDPKRDMWEKRLWTTQNKMVVYRSSWWWKL